MTDKEILERIVERKGRCSGVACQYCPYWTESGDCIAQLSVRSGYAEWRLNDAKQKPKEMESEMCDIPELKGVKMLVRDHGETCYSHATVIGRFEGIYIDSLRRQWQEAKPLPKPEEMTVAEICKELGREVKIIK